MILQLKETWAFVKMNVSSAEADIIQHELDTSFRTRKEVVKSKTEQNKNRKALTYVGLMDAGSNWKNSQ